MRKSIILVITIVIIPLVEALTLFGEEVSTLVLIPSVLIIVILIAFLSMIIKDKIKSKSLDTDLGLESEPPSLGGDSLDELPPIEPPSEESKTPQLSPEPKKDYSKEIQLLEKELPSKDIKEIHKKLNELIKGFFLDYLGLKYHFTFEELEKELKKGNKEIQCFSDNLSSITYAPKGISKEELVELIKEFKNIIVSSTHGSQPLTPEFKKETEENKKKIHTLLKKGGKLAVKDANKAKEDYNRISELYNCLPDNDKEAIKPQIMSFYNRLQH